MVLPNILVVDDDPTLVLLLGRMLQPCGRVLFARCGADALRMVRQSPPDLIVLDVEMPDMSGFEVCAALKESSDLAQIPVIFLTTHDSAEQEVTGLALGAADFIAKPPREHLLLARVQLQLRVRKLATELRQTSAVDGLTGLSSREHFEAELEAECARASRSGSPIAVLLISLDPQRAYAPERQQAIGEHALRSLAAVMRGTLQRARDLLARYGDTEFAAVLPDTDGTGAMLVAHNIIAAIDAQGVRYLKSPSTGHVTASVGVTVFDAPRAKRSVVSPQDAGAYPVVPVVDDLLTAVSRAVVSAKHAGGHCVCFVALEGVAKAVPTPTQTASLDGE